MLYVIQRADGQFVTFLDKERGFSMDLRYALFFTSRSAAWFFGIRPDENCVPVENIVTMWQG